MPVYNEARTLRTIVDRVLKSPIGLEIELVAVDDCSSDRSLEILEDLAANEPRLRVFHQELNHGKGAAIRRAIKEMTGDLAIIQDADLEYDPNEYPQLLAPILDGRADAVFGSRFAASSQRRVLFFWHSFGNRVLTTLSNMANDLNLTDMETCYKLVRADILKRIRLTSDRFGIEPEITARLAQWGARIYEVPISYHGRTYAEGKNIGWRDGLQALWLIFKFRFLDTRFTVELSHVSRQSLGRASAFRKWMLSQFNGLVKGRVLEVDAGPGHVTSLLLDSDSLLSTDSDPSFVETLNRRFGHLENVSFAVGGLEDNSLRAATGKHGFDTIFALEALQRVEDPTRAASELASVLAPGGHLLVQVPADPRLYGAADKALGHRRRFTSQGLRAILEAGGLQVVWLRSFNRLGRVGWKLHRSAGMKPLSGFEARAFGLLTPLAERVETLGGPGLSYLAVATTPGPLGDA
jgi:glycosyltransferase involved in cell wall biosynthesis